MIAFLDEPVEQVKSHGPGRFPSGKVMANTVSRSKKNPGVAQAGRFTGNWPINKEAKALSRAA
jgi:hypothetical protein